MTEQRKQVSFDENVKVERIPCRSSWSNDDISAMYYSYEELEKFQRRECRRICKLSMKSRLGTEETGQSLAEAETLRQKRVEDGICTVLQEQLIQSYRGEERNPDDIARAYSGATRESKQFARHRAFDIALQVLEHVDEETILWSCCTKNLDSGDTDTRLSDVGSTYASSPTRPKQLPVLQKMIVVPIE